MKPALYQGLKPVLFGLLCTVGLISGCEDPSTQSLPIVSEEIAEAEDKMWQLLTDGVITAKGMETRSLSLVSHPGRDALLRYLAPDSRSAARTLPSLEDNRELSDEEEQLIDDYLEAQPEVSEAIEAIIEDFNESFADLDSMPMEVEIVDGQGDVTGIEILYPKDGYYYMDGVAVPALSVLHEKQTASQEPPIEGEKSLGMRRGHWRLWPDRTVRYFIDSKNMGWNASDALRNRVKARFYREVNDLSRVTGIRFKEYKNTAWRRFRWLTSPSYVRVEFGSGKRCATACAVVGRSWLGYVRYNVKDNDSRASVLREDNISINDERLSTIQHELLHTLGMNHEHQRWDRDDHITVSMFGCVNGASNCNQRYSRLGSGPNTYDTPYDYNSVMHYGVGVTQRWCRDRNYIRNPEHRNRGCFFRDQNRIRYGTWLTPWDIYAVKYLYRFGSNPRPQYTPGED